MGALEVHVQEEGRFEPSCAVLCLQTDVAPVVLGNSENGYEVYTTHRPTDHLFVLQWSY